MQTCAGLCHGAKSITLTEVKLDEELWEDFCAVCTLMYDLPTPKCVSKIEKDKKELFDQIDNFITMNCMLFVKYPLHLAMNNCMKVLAVFDIH